MVAVNFDLSGLKDLETKLRTILDPEYLLRPLCFDLVDLMKLRIHVDGEDALDEPIGTYSKSYLKVREKKYQRSGDTKVIVSLTRQLENDWAVIPLENGYGIGFKNPFNVQKARWVEIAKLKEIFSLSPSELEYAEKKIAELVDDVFKS